jgi:hypothetical protein
MIDDDTKGEPPPLSYPPADGTTYTEILTSWFEQQHGRTSIGRLVEAIGGETSVVDVSGQQYMGEIGDIAGEQDMATLMRFVAAELHALRAALLALADGLDRQQQASP